MKRGTKGCVVPLHGELKVGALSELLRPAEVAPDDFIGAL